MDKVCGTCKLLLPLNKFAIKKSNGEPLHSCKECTSIYMKEYRAVNKSKAVEYNKQYRNLNKEKLQQRAKEYVNKNSESIKSYKKNYYMSNKETISVYAKKYREEHKEEVRLYKKEYAKSNQLKIAEYKKEYYENNKELIAVKQTLSSRVKRSNDKEYADRCRAKGREYSKHNRAKCNAKLQRYRAAKDNRTPKWLSAEDERVIDRKYRIASIMSNLGTTSYHVDHIVPLRGKCVSGLHVPSNLQILTEHSNTSKGNKHPSDIYYNELKTQEAVCQNQ